MEIRTSEIATLLQRVDPTAYQDLENAFSRDELKDFTEYSLGAPKTGPKDPFLKTALSYAQKTMESSGPTLAACETATLKRMRAVSALQFAGQLIGFLGGTSGLVTLKSGNPGLALAAALLAMLGSVMAMIAKYVESPFGQESLATRYGKMLRVKIEVDQLNQEIQLFLLDDPDRTKMKALLAKANNLSAAVLEATSLCQA